ncbi:MAG: ABC1 kinase family protein [Planctomycetota bacterium]|jgi:ubiquinone biosynthesis protein
MALLGGTRSTIRNLGRLRQIAVVLARHGFAELIERMNLRRFVPILGRRRPKAERMPVPERAAEALQELGATYVKLGQQLSQRPDILPEDWIQAFTRLQDRVKPFPDEEARAVLELALKGTAEERFREFETSPMASGSIAQVHAARLPDGREVVVKIRRPGIEKEMKADLALIAQLAALAERHMPEIRIYRPVELVEEFARSLERELDFIAEAASLTQFERNFRDDPHVVVPQVIWSHTEADCLTLTRIRGVPLSDKEAIEKAGADRKALARIIADCFLKQFFETGLFHADPHPGNLVVMDGDRLGLIDFGAVGHLSDETASELTAIMFALSSGDVSLIASVYEELGVLEDSPAERDTMLADFQSFFDRFYGLPADRVDIGRAFTDGVAIARRHNAHLPRELVLFGRAFVSALSTVQMLDPTISIGDVIRPYVRRLLVSRLSPERIGRMGARTSYHLLNLVRNLPGDMRSIIRKLRQGRLRFEFMHEGLEGFTTEVDRASNRLSFSIVIASIIIGSSYIMGGDVGPRWPALDFVGLGQVPILGLVGYLVAGVMGLGLAWAIYRSGKLKG